MGRFLLLLICLAAPFLIMWWMVRAQRRTRALTRNIRKEEALVVHPYLDGTTDEDGLVYGRPFGTDEGAFGEDPRAGEPAGIKAIEGRR